MPSGRLVCRCLRVPEFTRLFLLPPSGRFLLHCNVLFCSVQHSLQTQRERFDYCTESSAAVLYIRFVAQTKVLRIALRRVAE